MPKTVPAVELRIDERLAEELRRYVEPVLLFRVNGEAEALRARARASVKSSGANSARSRFSFPGSKRGCSAESFTEIDGRSKMASAFVAVKTPASAPTASIASM